MKKSAEMGEKSAANNPRFAIKSAHTSTPSAFSTCSDTCHAPQMSHQHQTSNFESECKIRHSVTAKSGK